jgi:hypothetical protein
VICTLDEYLARHESAMARGRRIPWSEHGDAPGPELRREILAALAEGPVYLTGGFSAELQGRGGTDRTPHDESARPHGVEYLKRRRQGGGLA